MAGLGALARLTQAASAERIGEQNFRSALFAQGRQEILQERQIRLQESEAIANRIERGIEREDRRREEAERLKLERERIAARSARGSGSGSGGGLAPPFIPGTQPGGGGGFPAIGEGFVGVGEGQPVGPAVGDTSVETGQAAAAPEITIDFKPTSMADNERVENKRTSLAQAEIAGKAAIETHTLDKPKQSRSIKNVQGDLEFQEALKIWNREHKGLLKGLADVQKQKKAWDDKPLWEKEELATADPRDIAGLEQAQFDEIAFATALEDLRSSGKPDRSVQVRGKNELFNEDQLVNGLKSAKARQAAFQARIDAFTPLKTKPPAIIGGSKGLERAAAGGNLNAQKANSILIGTE